MAYEQMSLEALVEKRAELRKVRPAYRTNETMEQINAISDEIDSRSFDYSDDYL